MLYILLPARGSTIAVQFEDYSPQYFATMRVTFQDRAEVPVLIRLRTAMDTSSARLSNLYIELDFVKDLCGLYEFKGLKEGSETRRHFVDRLNDTFKRMNKYHSGDIEILQVHFYSPFAAYHSP